MCFCYAVHDGKDARCAPGIGSSCNAEVSLVGDVKRKDARLGNRDRESHSASAIEMKWKRMN